MDESMIQGQVVTSCATTVHRIQLMLLFNCCCYYAKDCCRYLHNDTITTADTNTLLPPPQITDNTSITAAAGVKEDCRGGQHDDSEDYDVVTIENPAINGVFNPADSTANLPFDEHEVNKKDSDDDTTPCIQQRYVTATQKQVQSEVSKDDKSISNQFYFNMWDIITCGFVRVRRVICGLFQSTIKLERMMRSCLIGCVC
jgi:hypothetical protein